MKTVIFFCVTVFLLSNQVQADDCKFSPQNIEKCKEEDKECPERCSLKMAGVLKEGGALDSDKFIEELEKCPSSYGPNGPEGPPIEVPESMQLCLKGKESKCNENVCSTYEDLDECYGPPGPAP